MTNKKGRYARINRPIRIHVCHQSSLVAPVHYLSSSDLNTEVPGLFAAFSRFLWSVIISRPRENTLSEGVLLAGTARKDERLGQRMLTVGLRCEQAQGRICGLLETWFISLKICD